MNIKKKQNSTYITKLNKVKKGSENILSEMFVRMRRHKHGRSVCYVVMGDRPDIKLYEINQEHKKKTGFCHNNDTRLQL